MLVEYAWPSNSYKVHEIIRILLKMEINCFRKKVLTMGGTNAERMCLDEHAPRNQQLSRVLTIEGTMTSLQIHIFR